MTDKEFMVFSMVNATRVAELQTKVVEEARRIVPVLLDAGRAHSAKALQELLFEIDALNQEMDAAIREDPAAASRVFVNALARRAKEGF